MADSPRRFRCFLCSSPPVWTQTKRDANEAFLTHYLSKHYERPEVPRG